MTTLTPSPNEIPAWRRYLSPWRAVSPHKRAGAYKYPTSDPAVDANLDQQDSGKRMREQRLIRDGLDFEWNVAIDFGCGVGAQFHCFERSSSTDQLLIGIEPDAGRARTAQAAGEQRRDLEVIVANASAEVLAEAPLGLNVDAIVCNQVLGHISTEQRRSIVAAFAGVLRLDGRCIVSVPVVSGAPGSPSTDYTHLVDFSESPTAPGYRKTISSAQFDQEAEKSPSGHLPVRAFLLPEIPRETDTLPVRIDRVPPTLVEELGTGWKLQAGWFYSRHGLVAGSPVVIGDHLMVLSRVEVNARGI